MSNKWDLPPTYRAHGSLYRKVEQFPCRWGLYEEASRPGESYELVRPYRGKFPPPDARWGIDGYTFTTATHAEPRRAAVVKYTDTCAPTSYKMAAGEIAHIPPQPIP